MAKKRVLVVVSAGRVAEIFTDVDLDIRVLDYDLQALALNLDRTNPEDVIVWMNASPGNCLFRDQFARLQMEEFGNLTVQLSTEGEMDRIWNDTAPPVEMTQK